MANEEHLSRLKHLSRLLPPSAGPSVAAWNDWKREFHAGHNERGDRPPTVDLSGADLSKLNLAGIDLRSADLVGANLYMTILEGAELTFADLRGAILHSTQLAGAVLDGADLSNADLHNARLPNAILTHADLGFAQLVYTDLTGANLRNADLSGATLNGASLDQANLTAALLDETTFANVDLRSVRGLELVLHRGPSTVGVDTLYRSGGHIPSDFLLGCGVPSDLIAYVPALAGSEQAVNFNSCFISYSTRDDAFAERLHARLRQERVRVWFAPEDVKGGEKLHEQIDRAIELHDRLLLVLSEHSLASEWVMTEIRRARRQERRENRRKLFPIRLVPFDVLREWSCFDADSGKDLGVEVREYFIPDFTLWKDHDAFEVAFARLLRDLRGADSTELSLGLPTSGA